MELFEILGLTRKKKYEWFENLDPTSQEVYEEEVINCLSTIVHDDASLKGISNTTQVKQSLDPVFKAITQQVIELQKWEAANPYCNFQWTED